MLGVWGVCGGRVWGEKVLLQGCTNLTMTDKGVNWRSKYVTQVQQRPESPTVTLTWHACKYKVHKFNQR